MAVVATAVLAGSFASAAQALPSGFWGVAPQGLLSQEQFQRLSRGGVESLRIPFGWAGVQPSKGGAFGWATIDGQVGAASQAGIQVLPFLAGAPEWAVPSVFVPGSGRSVKAPGHLPVTGAARSGWTNFVKAAVARYGPNGTFWAENPTLPNRPIRTWQIWNEQNFKYFVAKPNPGEYSRLVKFSHAAVRGVDPGAKVILGGMFARPKGARNTKSGKHKSLNYYAADFLEEMYRGTPGIRSSYDGVALHPYTYNFQELAPEIEELRSLMKQNQDGATGLWITEVGWSSEHPTHSDLFAKGMAGQAQQLKGAFSEFKARQSKWRLKQIIWFSVDDQDGACNFCGGSGLFGKGFVPKKAWYAYVKFAGGTP
ncbi:MAG: hypothetical protein WD810_07995 [Solirubrobacterales bacterium]